MGLNRLRSEFEIPDSLDDAGAMRRAYEVNNQRRASEGKPAYSEDEWQATVERMEGGGASQAPASPGAFTAAAVDETAVPGPAMAKAPPQRVVGGAGTMFSALPNLVQSVRANTPPGGSPLHYILNTPQRAMGEVGDFVTGLGPALAAGVHMGGLGAIAHANPTSPVVARQLARAAGAAREAGPEVIREIGLDAAEMATNPGGSFLRRPVGTTLDALTLAESPSAGAMLGARVAARAGKKAAAKSLARFSARTSPQAVGARLVEGAEQQIPAVASYMKRSREVGKTRDIVADEAKRMASRAEEATAEQAAAFEGTRGRSTARDLLNRILRRPLAGPSEREQMTQAAMGLASFTDDAPEPMRRGLDWYKQNAALEEQQNAAEKLVSPRVADIRRRQPQRLVIGGEGQQAFEAAPRKELQTKGVKRRIKQNERDIKLLTPKAEQVTPRTEALAEAQKRARLSSKGAKLSQAASGRLRELDAALGRLDRSSPANAKTIARMLRRFEAEGAGKETAKAEGRAQALMREIKSELATKDPAEAARALLQKRITAAEADLAEGRLLMSRTQPGEAGRAAGTAARDLTSAKQAERSLKFRQEKAGKLADELAYREGRVPALDQLETQSALAKMVFRNEPSYVPMIPPRGERIKKGFQSLVPGFMRGAKAGKPDYLRRSKGSRFLEGNYEGDLSQIAARHTQAKLVYEKNRAILERAGQATGRPVKSIDEVDWANEALLDLDTYRRASIGEALSSGGDVAEELGGGAIAAILKKPAATKSRQLVAVPKHVARELEGQMKPLPGGALARALFDRPNDYLRWSALTLRPGFYVNNLVGNVALSTLAGTRPSDFLDASDPAIRAMLPNAVRGSGFSSVEAPASGVTSSAFRRVAEIPNRANEGVDDFMRAATVVGSIKKQAMEKSLRESGERLDKAMTFAQKMESIGPEGVDAAVKHANDFLNDYARQSPFQRRLLRRALPFQSFLVHMGRLATRLPVAYPGRANFVARLSEAANEYKDAQWEQSGINPDEVVSWRAGQLPIGDVGDQTITMGTAGFNPASGLGFGQSEMIEDPGVPGVLRNLLNQTGPFPQAVMALRGENALGRPFSKPGVYRPYGSDRAYSEETGQPVAPPTPSLVDIVRQSTPGLGLLERLLQPKETYDLVGSDFPWSPDYLPPREDEARKYGFREALSGYLGIPMRGFEREEVVMSKRERDNRGNALESGRKSKARKESNR